MQDENTMRDRLIEKYVDMYMEKLFYFCLKKTGNHEEAENLSQDIALNVLTALNKGIVPNNFSAWVWQIANNRYAVWATEKHKRNESISEIDIGDYELPDQSENILNDIIHIEQISLLRRELAFVKSDYRDIIVAYYLEGRNLRDIADHLSLPLETAKKRLQRARIILKEGMSMAREFGMKSYSPEDVDYINNCARPSKKNQPYNIMERILYKNIFLEAYGNPSTAEELAMELGIALPYMEDALEYLTRETFLMKENGKYQTAFPIVSASAQEQTYNAWLSAAPAITKSLMNFIERLNDAFTARKQAYYGEYLDYESAKWSLLVLALDHFLYKAPSVRERTERPDGGRWDIIGYQHCRVKQPNLVGENGNKHGIQLFKYEVDGIADRTPDYLTDEEAKVLYDCVSGKFFDETYEIANRLAEYGYLCKKGNAYVPAIVILKKDEIKNAVNHMDSQTVSELTALADVVTKQAQDLYHKIAEIICKDLPKVFSKNMLQCRLAISNCYICRGYVMAEALRQGYLLPPEKVSPAIGAHIYLK